MKEEGRGWGEDRGVKEERRGWDGRQGSGGGGQGSDVEGLHRYTFSLVGGRGVVTSR